MSESVNWYRGNHLLLDVVAPLDKVDPSAHVVMDAATTIQAHIFSKRTKSTASAAEAAAAVTITLDDLTDLAVGDVITIEESDGNFTRHPVTVLAPTTKIVTFTTGLTVGSVIGARVWKTYGAAVVTGVAYGTADVAKTDWGYVFDVPYTYDTTIRRNENLEAMAVLHKTSTTAHYEQLWDVILAEAYGPP